MTASRTPVIVGIGLSDGPVAPHLDAVQHHVVAMRLLDAARARGLAGDPATRQRLAEVYTGEQLLRFLGYRGLPPEPRVDKHVPFRDLVFSSTTRASVGGSTRSPSSTRRRPEPDLEVEGDR